MVRVWIAKEGKENFIADAALSLGLTSDSKILCHAGPQLLFIFSMRSWWLVFLGIWADPWPRILFSLVPWVSLSQWDTETLSLVKFTLWSPCHGMGEKLYYCS